MARVAGHFMVLHDLMLHHKSHAVHRLLILPAKHIGAIREMSNRNLTRRHHGFYFLSKKVPNVHRTFRLGRQIEYIVGRNGHGVYLVKTLALLETYALNLDLNTDRIGGQTSPTKRLKLTCSRGPLHFRRIR